MKSLGIKDAFMDEHCYVYGTLEKNTDKTHLLLDYRTYGHIS